MNTITRFLNRSFFLATGVLVATFGFNSSLWAAACAFDPDTPEVFGARYVLRVDAGTTCEELSMIGCDPIVNGTGTCVAGDMSVTFSIDATPDSPTEGSLSWVSNTAAKPDVILIKGGTQGNGCGYFNPDEYAAGAGLGDLNNKLAYTGIKSAQACTDNRRNPVFQAVLQVTKKVTTPDTDCMSAGDPLNVMLADPAAGVEVKYCYAVSNIGGGAADISTIVDDNGDGYYDSTCTDCVDNDFEPYTTPMMLAPGETVFAEALVTINKSGTTTNVVAAYGTWTDPNDPATVVDLYAEDSATVVARQVLEPCPVDPQTVMDGFVEEEDGFDFGYFLDSDQPSRSAMCVPTGVKVKGVQCLNECVTKSECIRDADGVPAELPASCSPPEGTTCEPSGVWDSEWDAATADVLPYCWEVAMDRDRDGSYKKLSPLKTNVLTVTREHENPYTGRYCSNSGGREVCFDYCYPAPGDAADVCN